MAVEDVGRLRTIAIVGQGGAGKTQTAEAMLFTAGATTRLGRPDEFAALVRHVVENEMINGAVLRLDGALRMGPK